MREITAGQIPKWLPAAVKVMFLAWRGIGGGDDRVDVDLGPEDLGLSFEELHALGEQLGRDKQRPCPRVGLCVGAAAGDRLDHLQCC